MGGQVHTAGPPVGSVLPVRLNMAHLPVCPLEDNVRVDLGKMRVFP